MARTSIDQNIGTPTARKRLAPRQNAYFRRVTDKISVGYRRGQKLPGVWTVRTTDENGKYSQRKLDGVADDIERANGIDVLSYDQAVEQAREVVVLAPIKDRAMTETPTGAKPKDELTVEDALGLWVEMKVRDGMSETGERNLRSGAKSMGAVFEDVRLTELTVKQVLDFRDGFLVGFPRERHRARRSTANRALANLKAALNYTVKREELEIAQPWNAVEKFSKVESFGKRVIVCSKEQEAALIEAAPTEQAANLWRAGFLTGCRLGELVSAKVGHLSKRRLKVSGKTGERELVLSTKANEFFWALVEGCNDMERPLLLDESGEAWTKGRTDKLLPATVKAADGVDSDTTFYATRHTYITRYLGRGVNITAIAKQCGTSWQQIERTYANFLSEDLEKWFDD